VQRAVGEEGVRSSIPGRNSDQAFNGIGLPLLQFNHARSAEVGGYWWWHTPDDTYDKIDFDVLMTDAGLYARAIARLTTDPVLPIDMVAEVETLGAQIERRSEQSGRRFDLDDAMARQRTLLASVRAVQDALAGQQGVAADEAILRILRPIYRVMYDPVDPFHPDPGFSVGLLPGLAPVTILAEEDSSTDRYLFAETTLVRERNRLLEALTLSSRAVEELLGSIER
jgi:aminopeptidase YwaD